MLSTRIILMLFVEMLCLFNTFCFLCAYSYQLIFKYSLVTYKRYLAMTNAYSKWYERYSDDLYVLFLPRQRKNYI